MSLTTVVDSATEAPNKTVVAEQEFLTTDDLLSTRAADEDQIPLINLPRSERGITDFVGYTAKYLDRMVDHVANRYIELGVKPRASSGDKPAVIALLGQPDIPYIVTFFAVARLGLTSLCLSPRLAPNACAKLIEETEAFAVIPGKSAQMASLVAETQVLLRKPIEELPLLEQKEIDKASSKDPRFQREGVDRKAETNLPLTILHSSGSAGLPKSIPLSHRQILLPVPPQKGQTEFSTFPFFHRYGNYVLLHAMMNRRMIYLSNSNMPITADYCLKVLESVRPDILHVVPYTMELLALSETGIDAMAKCQAVVFAGAACPDNLGNELVAKGVNVENFWGATEIGMLGTSFNRPPGDDSWDYIRIPPSVVKFIWMKPLGDGTCECVYLHGLPALAASNSDDPPKSFYSNDVFVKHPKLEAWKHIGRLDDRLTLVNGEKVLPVPIEDHIRLNPLIRECCIFGTGKSVPGLIVFRRTSASQIPDEEYIDAIWPTIQEANANAESFSQLSKDTIITFSADVDYPKTDKLTMKRAQIYRVFSAEIDALYERLENSGTGTLQLDTPELEKWLMKTFSDDLGVQLSTGDDDFFAAGINSLQAIQTRGLILKTIDLGGNSKKLGPNVVFDTGNVVRLARHLDNIRFGKATGSHDEDEVKEMAALIEKYSSFKRHIPGSASQPDGHVILLTGATGSLGAHVLAQLLQNPKVHTVYCLARGENPKERILQALQQRGLSIPDNSRLIALHSDLSKPDLGLSVETYKQLQSQVTSIIHSAWAVNFNLGVRSFEEQHIKGVYNLTQLSLSVHTPQPAHIFFCSSIAAALGTPGPATIPEGPIQDLSFTLPQGYGRSKLVGEHILQNATTRAGALTRTLRSGQVVGDSKMGLWNDSEAIPLIIRSALTLKALPALDETESWLPVDTLATTILDLSGITSNTNHPPEPDTTPSLTYNILNPNIFSWTTSLLPALAHSGLSFATVPVTDWLHKLREYEKNGGDPERNPAIKLIGHFERMYGGTEKTAGDVTFELKTAKEYSKALREAPRLVEDGFIEKFVNVWMGKWSGEGEGVGVESSG